MGEHLRAARLPDRLAGVRRVERPVRPEEAAPRRGALFALSSVPTGWAGSFTAFVTWRIAGGVAIGMASSLSPMYIAEIAPAHLRGRLVAVNQLTIVIGILAAQIVNWLIAVRLPFEGTADVESARAAWNGRRAGGGCSRR